MGYRRCECFEEQNIFTVFPRLLSSSISISRQVSDRAISNEKAEKAFKGRRISPPSIGHATRSEGYRTASSSEAPRRILRHPSGGHKLSGTKTTRTNN